MSRRIEPTVGLVNGQKYRSAVDTDIRRTFARIRRDQALSKAQAAQGELPGISPVVVPLVRGAR